MIVAVWLSTAIALAAGAPPATKAPATKAECTDQCLLLTRLPFAEVQSKICDLCGKHDEMVCELDWPSSDVPPCRIWDDMRNCIFAHYGYAFKTPRLRKYFEKKPWYRKNAAFDPKSMPKVAKDNVQRLLKFKKEKYMCIDLDAEAKKEK